MKKTVSQLFTKVYCPILYLKQRHPKAAKRRRILKKWHNRFNLPFGIDSYLGAMLTPEPFEDMFNRIARDKESEEIWQGKRLTVL